MKIAAVSAVALLLSAGVAAQTVYRCGSLYSTTPCGQDQREVKVGPAPGPAPSVARKLKPVDDFANAEQRAADERSCLAAVANRLKDPESARFSEVLRLGAYEAAPGSKRVVVRYGGYVNARNSYGGYVGKKMFSCDLGDGAASAYLFD